MKKLSELFKRYREIIMYLIFGVLTTLVGWGVYFAIFWSWKAGFGIPADDTTSTMYLVGYSIAQIVQWLSLIHILRYFDTNTHGDIMSIYTNDIDALRQIISQSLPQLMSTMITLVVLSFVMMYLSIELFLAVLVGLVCILWVTKKIGRCV